MNPRGPQVDAFGGVAGRVLREAMSLGTLGTGLTLLISLGSLGFIMSRFEADTAFSVLVHLTIAFALARFALNGLGGEWGGTIFSSRGGSWIEVGSVSLRFLTLSALWVLPVLILGWSPGEFRDTVILGMGGKKTLILSTLVGTLMALTPPVFLIVSVSAISFKDIFDPARWQELFEGRLGELFLVYVVYLGAAAMVTALLLPLVVSIAMMKEEAGVLLGIFALAFGAGLAVNLLGRLCGFFALVQPGAENLPAGSGLPPTPPRIDVEEALEAAVQEEVVSPPMAAIPVAEVPQPASDTVPESPRGAPLLEARPRVEELARRFETDPEGAIQALGELRHRYLPHPLVLHRLCLCLHQSGYAEESLEVCREALPLCVERGALALAAEIFSMHMVHAEEFDLSRDAVLSLADVQRKTKELYPSEHTYAHVLDLDSGERRAVKGLLQVAEAYLEHGDFQDSRRVYVYLLDRCPGSPLAVHMHEGLAEADRRLAKAS